MTETPIFTFSPGAAGVAGAASLEPEAEAAAELAGAAGAAGAAEEAEPPEEQAPKQASTRDRTAITANVARFFLLIMMEPLSFFDVN